MNDENVYSQKFVYLPRFAGLQQVAVFGDTQLPPITTNFEAPRGETLFVNVGEQAFPLGRGNRATYVCFIGPGPAGTRDEHQVAQADGLTVAYNLGFDIVQIRFDAVAGPVLGNWAISVWRLADTHAPHRDRDNAKKGLEE